MVFSTLPLPLALSLGTSGGIPTFRLLVVAGLWLWHLKGILKNPEESMDSMDITSGSVRHTIQRPSTKKTCGQRT